MVKLIDLIVIMAREKKKQHKVFINHMNGIESMENKRVIPNHNNTFEYSFNDIINLLVKCASKSIYLTNKLSREESSLWLSNFQTVDAHELPFT